MNKTLHLNPLENIYKEKEPLIKSIVYKLHTVFGIDMTELKSEADLLFMLAINTYQEGKASLTTHLYARIQWGLLDYIRKINKQKTKFLELHNDVPDLNNRFLTVDFFESLKGDAQLILELVQCEDIEWIVQTYHKGKRPPKKLVNVLKHYLRKELKWKPSRIQIAFDNLKEAL